MMAEPATLRELLAQLNEQGITDYRRYRAVRKFLDFKARKKNVPISGSFELTPLCNLDCKMCYVHLNKEQMNGAQLLTVDQWKNLMQQAIDSGMMYARLTGGECLTYPGFRELYLFLLEKGVEVSILSNGLLMEDDMVDFLLAHPPSAIQVTLYGASEDGYEAVTGKRVFERVMKNIRRLKELDFPMQIAVTPNAFMQDGEQIIRLLHENGFHYSINAGLMQPREETGRQTADAGLDAYVAMLKLQAELRGKSFEPECDPESLPDPGSEQKESPVGVRCGAGRSGFAIDWRGRMRPCNNFPCEGVDVLTNGVAEAWKQTNHTALNYPLPTECQGCAYKEICKHCVAEHAAAAPAGHASPAICAWGKRMIAEGLFVLKQPEQ
ncbi:MAG: radical SAM protein [Clostridia bacterium]|nr:radical SAM protein [Clostridia bacterium]